MIVPPNAARPNDEVRDDASVPNRSRSARSSSSVSLSLDREDGHYFTKIWSDQDMIELKIEVSNGTSLFSNQVYVGYSDFKDAVKRLDTFKDHSTSYPKNRNRRFWMPVRVLMLKT